MHDESLNRGYSVEKSGMEDRALPEDDLKWVVLQLKSLYKSKFEINFPPLSINALNNRICQLLDLTGRITLTKIIRVSHSNGN